MAAQCRATVAARGRYQLAAVSVARNLSPTTFASFPEVTSFQPHLLPPNAKSVATALGAGTRLAAAWKVVKKFWLPLPDRLVHISQCRIAVSEKFWPSLEPMVVQWLGMVAYTFATVSEISLLSLACLHNHVDAPRSMRHAAL